MRKRKIAQKETAFHHLWRPAIGWAFLAIILFDFIIAPGITLAMIKSGLIVAHWVPLTLDSVGTFYLAMGAILGITSWTRGQEKVEQIRQGYDFGTDDDVDSEKLDPPL